jgi:hypothetical protein
LQKVRANREGLRVKGGTNIQVNGNVYGGIHVNGGGPAVACFPPSRPPRGDRAATDFWWIVCKGLGLLGVGAFAIVGAVGLAAALLVVALAVLGLALAWWLVCRLAEGVRLTEEHVISARDIASLLPNTVRGVRALASGERVTEIESTSTEMTRYVD